MNLFCSFLLFYLIFFIPLHLRISLAKRWLDLLNNSRILIPPWHIKPNLPKTSTTSGFLSSGAQGGQNLVRMAAPYLEGSPDVIIVQLNEILQTFGIVVECLPADVVV